MTDTAAVEERLHLEEVVTAFREYAKYQTRELDRQWVHLCKLSPDHAQRLPPQQPKLKAKREAIANNQLFLEAATTHVDDISLFEGVLSRTTIDYGDPRVRTSVSNMSKMRSTLHSCVREWCAEGAAERADCFGPLVAAILDFLPVTRENRHKQRVLVPGAGLGRLPLEIASRGYACQGNEFSYFMLLTSNLLLNRVSSAEAFAIHPFIEQTCNELQTGDSCRQLLIPDVDPGLMLGLKDEQPEAEEEGEQQASAPDFSMTAGDWLQVYADQEACWDGVATCFFLDTAPVVIEYIEAIHRLLRPGGVWVNIGPLLYHWAATSSAGRDQLDDRYQRSVELSWEEVKHVILSYGFRLEREEIRQCRYAANSKSMMSTVYNCVFFVAVKGSAAVVQGGEMREG